MKQENNLYFFGREIATRSLVPKVKVYDEKVMIKGRDHFRVWDPEKSKLGAAFTKGLKNTFFKDGSKVLYLGIASGTSASHVSDIIGNKGIIYGIEFASRPLRDLMLVCRKRKNIIPMLADARLPDTYANKIEKVDIIFQDIAQRDQADIFLNNMDLFLKSGGIGLIAIKAKCIDVTKKVRQVFREQKEHINTKYKVIQEIPLAPYELDHTLFVVRRK
ncbi:MAG: fibrillarin-like rRNA/tRNA 2'-O-methyltransferase [Candidatus Aenigmarchaeota archaeon]|nr:fibrillarin-like rRNA/tRNA 2'-O-methyltransferase [Candidatus Aenigmarchaeota archaeon]MCK5321805.1 fibrillarin-like rRNA/tRNA 2'-O-methyltransferase [Candidatus Aenigmarchaeota archaeon]